MSEQPWSPLQPPIQVNPVVAWSKPLAAFGLGTLYLGLAVAAITLLGLICRRDRRVDFYKWFYALVFVVCAVRGSFWYVHEIQQFIDSYTYYVVWTIPGDLIFSTFSLLVFIWADAFMHSHGRMVTPAQRRRRVLALVLMNAVMYLIQLGLFLTLAWETWPFQHGQPIFFSVVSLGSTVAFIVYGTLLYCSMRRTQAAFSLFRRRELRKILAIVITVSVTFVIRATFNSIWVDLVENVIEAAGYYYVFIMPFYLVVEILPLLLVLIVITKIPAKIRAPALLQSRGAKVRGTGDLNAAAGATAAAAFASPHEIDTGVGASSLGSIVPYGVSASVSSSLVRPLNAERLSLDVAAAAAAASTGSIVDYSALRQQQLLQQQQHSAAAAYAAAVAAATAYQPPMLTSVLVEQLPPPASSSSSSSAAAAAMTAAASADPRRRAGTGMRTPQYVDAHAPVRRLSSAQQQQQQQAQVHQDRAPLLDAVADDDAEARLARQEHYASSGARSGRTHTQQSMLSARTRTSTGATTGADVGDTDSALADAQDERTSDDFSEGLS